MARGPPMEQLERGQGTYYAHKVGQYDIERVVCHVDRLAKGRSRCLHW